MAQFATVLGPLYAVAVAWVIFSTCVTLFVLSDWQRAKRTRAQSFTNERIADDNRRRLLLAAKSLDEIENAREHVSRYAQSIGFCPDCRKQPSAYAAKS